MSTVMRRVSRMASTISFRLRNLNLDKQRGRSHFLTITWKDGNERAPRYTRTHCAKSRSSRIKLPRVRV